MPEMDMRRMQEEAARRAREMQSRARQSRQPEHTAQEHAAPPLNAQPGRQRPMESAASPFNAQPGRQRPANTPAPEPAPPPPPAPSAVEAALQAPGGEAPKSLLDELFMDRERTVLLALLLLLSGEEGSHELMFALLFLLM